MTEAAAFLALLLSIVLGAAILAAMAGGTVAALAFVRAETAKSSRNAALRRRLKIYPI